jgi:uncharacterized protein (TIGR02453 family)
MKTNTRHGFKGFSKECVRFYSDLVKNNNKPWFDEHKPDFEAHVMQPARDFVYEMGERLKIISPKVVADPRINKSIFRPFRDTRFSKDKTPYKTHLGIFFWEGPLAKMDCPGYYFHIEPPMLMLGVGNHCFSRPVLEAYRDAVVDDSLGKALGNAIETVKSKGDYSIGEKQYKKVPRGYDKDHPNAELLLYGGLTAFVETPIPDELYSPDIIEYVFERFEHMAPIHAWLLQMTRLVKT